MAILVGQLIEILQKYDLDREVTIHMLIGMIVGLVALLFITIDRYYEIKDEKNGNR